MGLFLGLESQAVPRILAVPKSSHGTQIFGTGSPVPCSSLIKEPVSWTFWSTTLDPVGHTEPSTDTDKRCTFAFFSDYLPGNFGYVKVLKKNDFKS